MEIWLFPFAFPLCQNSVREVREIKEKIFQVLHEGDSDFHWVDDSQIMGSSEWFEKFCSKKLC